MHVTDNVGCVVLNYTKRHLSLGWFFSKCY